MIVVERKPFEEIKSMVWDFRKILTVGCGTCVAGEAMELMGSCGSAYDYHSEKYLRDVKILQLWLGGPQRALLDTALGYDPFEW